MCFVKKYVPFRVRAFEAGMGRQPAALIKKARRSAKTRKGRQFVGVDEEVNLNIIIRQKLGLLPKNLRLVQNCAIKELLSLPAGSRDLIFGSFIVNVLGTKKASCAVPPLPCDKAFFMAAERALRPGGRLILVQDKDELKFMQEVAHNLGLELHQIPISDEKARKSESWAIRKRSTPETRIAHLNEDLVEWGMTPERYLSSKKARVAKITSIEEADRPTIFLFRKPKTPREKVREEKW